MNPEFSVKRAHRTQLELSKNIILKDKLPRKIRYVAGVDAAYIGQLSIGTPAVLDYDSLEVIEEETACCSTSLPYIPTLLSFREIMPTVMCIRRLHVQPDLFLVDGHGFAHPYRCGFASHLGLVIGKPTIGVAKEKLVGNVVHAKGEPAFISRDGEVIGAAVNTGKGPKPIYVSVGHMVSLETAIKIVKHCIGASRVPEPISKAHKIANAEKTKNQYPSAAKARHK